MTSPAPPAPRDTPTANGDGSDTAHQGTPSNMSSTVTETSTAPPAAPPPAATDGVQSAPTTKPPPPPTPKPHQPSIPAAYVSQFPADSASSRDSPQLQPFSVSTQAILDKIGYSSNVFAGSPAWEAKRKQVVESMNGAAHFQNTADTSVPLDVPKRGRGRGRPPLRKTLEARAAAAAAAAASGESSPATISVSTPTRAARGQSRGRGVRGGRRGTKRKRGGDGEDANDSSSLSSAASTDGRGTPQEPTVTKSGRSVNKPAQFAPTPKTDSPSTTPAKRVRRLNRKSQEAAVCTKCLRGHSTATNLIVFCDGCNSPWHQYCHDPPIGNDAVEQVDKDWYCGSCQADKEEAALPMDSRVGAGDYTLDERIAYLETLSRPTMIKLLLRASQRDPTFPAFAPNLRDLVRGRALSLPNGQGAALAAKTVNGHDPYPEYTVAAQTNDPPSTYPRPGRGPIPPKATTSPEDLEWLIDDDNGFAVFSHYYNAGPDASGAGQLVSVQTESNGTKGSWIRKA